MIGWLTPFLSVVLIDLVLAGDNAVVIGTLAAALPDKQRRTAVIAGTAFAVLARIVFSLTVVWLLLIPGAMIVGGCLLLWIAWGMWRDLRVPLAQTEAAKRPQEALHRAIIAIVVADLSMSFDNVLGVAGAAQGHIPSLILGLTLSVVLMGMAASVIAGVINKHRWIGYVGLALVVAVAVRMIIHGF